MRPIKVRKSNFVMRGPSPDVGDLWVERTENWEGTGDPALVSTFRPSILNAGGGIELAIFGRGMPPVALNVCSPEDAEPVGEHHTRISDAEIRETTGR
jgi:hypothetical protein